MTNKESAGVKIREHNRLLVIPDLSEVTGGFQMFYAGGLYHTPDMQVKEWDEEYTLPFEELFKK
jgi:hypothetical protein